MPATTTTAAALIPEDVARLLIEPLEAASVVLAAGPQIFDTSRPLSVPRLVGSDAPSFVAEGNLIPEVHLSFDDVSLMPNSRKGIKAISTITEEALRASVLALDAAVQARLVADNARTLDEALFSGTGAANTITGLLSQPGTMSGDLDLTDYDSMFDAIGAWMAAEVDPTRGRFYVHPTDWTTLRKTKSTDGRYLAQPDPTVSGQRSIDGIGVTITSRIPVGTVALVDMGMVAIARDQAAAVQVLRELYAATGHVGIKVSSRWDLGLLHPEAVLLLTPAAP